MSQHQEVRSLNLPLATSTVICQRVLEGLKWKLQEQSDSRFVAKEPFLTASAMVMGGNPATVEIKLDPESSASTKITYKASNTGFGPLNTGRCKRAISTIHERMEAEAMPLMAIKEVAKEVQNAVAEGVLCPTCGKSLAPGTRFCPNDGTPITKVCSKCNHNNAPGAKFCSNCGTEI